MESALRTAAYAAGFPLEKIDVEAVRGMDDIKRVTFKIGEQEIKIGVAATLANAEIIIDEIKKGAHYDYVEVMACPGGCIAGAGQPITHSKKVREQRTTGIYNADKSMQLQKSQDNYMVEQCYQQHLGGGCNSETAHHALHTGYSDRSDIFKT